MIYSVISRHVAILFSIALFSISEVTAQSNTTNSPNADVSHIRKQCIEAHQIITKGRLSEAEFLARSGYLEATDKLGSENALSRYCRDTLARVYFLNERFLDAIDIFLEVYSERLALLGESNHRTIETKHNLAMSYSKVGDYDKALQIYLELLDTFEFDNANEQTIPFEYFTNTLHQIGILHIDRKEYNSAKLFLESSLNERTKYFGENHISRFNPLGSIALLKHRQGMYEESLGMATSTYDALSKEYGSTYPGALRILSTIIDSAVHVDKALSSASADQFVKSHRRRAMLEQQVSSGSEQRHTTVAQSAVASNTALSLVTISHTEGKSLSGLAANTMLRMKGLGGEYDFALRKVAAEKGGASIELVKMLQNLWPKLEALERSGNSAKIKSMHYAIGKTELELAKLSPDFSEFLEAPEWKKISNALPKGSVLLEYMIYNPHDFMGGLLNKQLHLGAVLLNKGEEPLFKPLGPLDKELEADILILTSLDKLGLNIRTIRNASRAVYRRLAEPFDALIKEATAVYLSPDDVLHRVPFDLLRTPRGFWGFEQPLHIIPTGRSLKASQSRKNDGRFITIGGSNYGKQEALKKDVRGGSFTLSEAVTVAEVSKMRGNSWGPLPGAVAEVNELAQLFESSKLFSGKVPTPLSGEAATEAAMRAVSGPPAILHLATHGGATDEDFADNPLSRVVLGFTNVNRAGLIDGEPTENDGLMRGTDIAQLNLHGTRLVTLSACDTGDGVRLRGEGVMSLAHAFRLAGAQNVLMTYWSVDDIATRRFMQEFYTTWLDELETDEDASPHRALRFTKQSWADKGEHPRYWAAFALIENQVGE